MRELRKWKAVEVVREKLAGCDMEERPAFYLNKEWCMDPQVLSKAGPALALAKGGAMQLRVRSAFAHSVASVGFAALPEFGPFSRQMVERKMRNVFFADGGTENTLGRLAHAYPKRGTVIPRPVTQAEAQEALRGSGIDLSRIPSAALRPYPLLPFKEGEGAVTVNPKSDNGFPVLAQWETPGASEKAMRLAVSIRNQLTARSTVSGGVRRWKEEMEASNPQLVAVRGKAKADYYSGEKIVAGKMRFYNALGRQVVLNMQVATQPLEQLAKHILEGSRTGIGLSLHRGGAEQLVDELDRRLAAEGQAFVHVGDDSWVIVRSGRNLVQFALDCSNFDLTQHADATLEVHKAVHRQLERIDATAADLWFEYARGRLVVVCGAVTRYWRHAGPSGMPLQSKVNDMLMDVLIRRALGYAVDWESEEAVDTHLVKVGKELGFEVRVEQHSCLRADSVREALERVPFLFVGYNFFVRGGQVQVVADWARQMAQMPFPGLKWMKTGKELQVMEAMRLGSILLSMGLPHPDVDAAYTAMLSNVTQLVSRTLQHFGDVEDKRLRWAVSESPLGPATEGNLSGLLRALKRDPRVLWLEKEKELPSTSVLVGLSWADEVEQEEDAEVARKEAVRVPKGVTAKPLPVLARKPATHPVTARNDGRPPPTAVWGPNKAPRQVGGDGGGRRRRGRVLEEEEEGWETSEGEGEVDPYSDLEDEYAHYTDERD